ncbi:MAG: winged helix-turn-helix domain-containing protein [Lysobacterales bacterium]|jgi:TolB-like protein/DNA-binding winged helix-turn-helix (wHTH) protein/tetratricopeptide (TPR) repeat protein
MFGSGKQAARAWRVGDLDVYPGRREVRRGNEAISLPRLSYRLLIALAEAAPDVLSHDEMVSRVWPGRVITPETITQRVRLLRQALGDDAQDPRYIGLVRGEGYRLLVDVSPAPLDAGTVGQQTLEPGSPQRRLAIVVLLAALAVASLWLLVGRDSAMREPPENTVAVLPFVNASEDPGNDYLGTGLADELRDQLGRVTEMKVSARASSRVFQSEPADAREIAARLGVRWLIEGTVRREGEQLSVSIQVIDGQTGFSTLSRRFDREDQSLVAVHQDMAQAVIGQLLGTGAPARGELAPISGDVSAYELLLLARDLELDVRDQAPRIDVDKLDRAIDLYREATQIDPDSALAFSRLGGALLYRGEVADAEQPIRRALRINPELSEVQYNLGLYLWARRDAQAGEAFQRAVDANPNNVDALWELAKWQWHHQLVDGPERLFRRGLELDPLSLSRYTDLGNFYGIMGKRDHALELAARVEKLFPNPAGYSALARIYEVSGALDEAIAWAMLSRQFQPGRPDASWQVAELYARLGDADSARRFEPTPGVGQLFYTRRYPELIDLGEDLLLDYPEELKLYYLVAFAHNAMGHNDLAVYMLRRAGLPKTAMIEGRKADAIEALVTMTDALGAMGDRAETERLGTWLTDHFQIMLDTGGERAWWPNLYQACVLSSLGEDDRALERLDRVVDSPGLVWYPVLKDAPCFQRLASTETYRQVLAAIEGRMAGLRDAVPAALARHNVVSADDGSQTRSR